MTDHRRIQSIQGRYDIEISRWSFPVRRRRLLATILCGIVSLLACVPLLWSDHRILESRPVSRPHQVFEQQCQQCHTEQWKPLVRLATFNNKIRSVPDAACRKCHGETVDDHLFKTNNESGLLEEASAEQQELLHHQFGGIACSECHQEHRGQAFLSNVSDSYCTDCHVTLNSAGLPTPFFLDMKSFADHAEFAAVREIKDRSLLERHPSAQLARFEDGVLKDNVSLKFNHHIHLDPELRSAGGKIEQLTCQSCHIPDASGSYFQPIRYETSCKRCHQLGTKETGELPHVNPEMIRGLLLEKVSRFTPAQSEPSSDPIGGPTKPPVPDPAEQPVAERWGELQKNLAQLEERLFGPEGDKLKGTTIPGGPQLLETSCTKCHFTRVSAGERIPWSIVPPHIPDRWFPMSVFNHQAHGAIACEDCHTRSGKAPGFETRNEFYPIMTLEQHSSSSIFASTSAEDILLPSIKVCQTCHGTSRTTNRGVVSARSDCFVCHNYHHSPKTSPENSILLELLGAKTSKEASTKTETATSQPQQD